MRLAFSLVTTLLAMTALIWLLQRKLIYFPSSDVPDARAVGLNGAVPVTFPTTDGLTLAGWFVSVSAQPEFAVLVFNGNAGNRADRAGFANALAQLGLAVFVFDYRGYGGNPGTPTEEGLRLDARAARKALLSRPGVDATRVVYFGESLGTAVAAELASEHPPVALVLRSPFASMAEVGRYHYPFLPVGVLLRDRFDTLARIPHIRAPLLVIAGDADHIVPIAQSRRVFEAASDPKALLVIPGADHNDAALFTGRMLVDGLLRFLRHLG